MSYKRKTVNVTHFFWFNWKIHRVEDAYNLWHKRQKPIITWLEEYNKATQEYSGIGDKRKREKIRKLESKIRWYLGN